MCIQATVGVRITLNGDGKATKFRFDLRDMPVQLAGQYRLLPKTPDSIVNVSMGGPQGPPLPAIGPRFIQSIKLEGSVLSLEFISPLLDFPREPYTLEIIFGYNGLDDEPPPPREVL